MFKKSTPISNTLVDLIFVLFQVVSFHHGLMLQGFGFLGCKDLPADVFFMRSGLPSQKRDLKSKDLIVPRPATMVINSILC